MIEFGSEVSWLVTSCGIANPALWGNGAGLDRQASVFRLNTSLAVRDAHGITKALGMLVFSTLTHRGFVQKVFDATLTISGLQTARTTVWRIFKALEAVWSGWVFARILCHVSAACRSFDAFCTDKTRATELKSQHRGT